MRETERDREVDVTVTPFGDILAPKMSVFSQLDEAAMELVDFSHPSALKHGHVFMQASEIFRTMKILHPEWIKDIFLLTMPMGKEALGTCRLCPEGLGNPALDHITSDMMDNLLVVMASSEAMKDRIDPSRNQEVELKKRKVAAKAKSSAAFQSKGAKVISNMMTKKGKLRKQVGKKRGSGNDLQEELEPLADAEPELLDHDTQQQDFLESTRDWLNKIRKKDPNLRELDALKFIALKAGLTGKMTLTVKGKPRLVTGWGIVGSIIKVLRENAHNDDTNNFQSIKIHM